MKGEPTEGSKSVGKRACNSGPSQRPARDRPTPGRASGKERARGRGRGRAPRAAAGSGPGSPPGQHLERHGRDRYVDAAAPSNSVGEHH